MAEVKIPKTGVALERLAQSTKLKHKKRREPSYKKGSPTDKVWVNFQTTKELKKKFVERCSSAPKINASKFLRDCLELFIKTNGVFANTVNTLRLKKESPSHSKAEENSEASTPS